MLWLFVNIYCRHFWPKTEDLDQMTKSPSHCLNYAFFIVPCLKMFLNLIKLHNKNIWLLFGKPVTRGKIEKIKKLRTFNARVAQICKDFAIICLPDFQSLNCNVLYLFEKSVTKSNIKKNWKHFRKNCPNLQSFCNNLFSWLPIIQL